jgi:hypothetical protein
MTIGSVPGLLAASPLGVTPAGTQAANVESVAVTALNFRKERRDKRLCVSDSISLLSFVKILMRKSYTPHGIKLRPRAV